jgi:hypothetical protein
MTEIKSTLKRIALIAETFLKEIVIDSTIMSMVAF